MTDSDIERVALAAKRLTKAQRVHVLSGGISGDFSMLTVRNLIDKGIMYLRIDSPNGRWGFVELTDFGRKVRARLSPQSTEGGE